MTPECGVTATVAEAVAVVGGGGRGRENGRGGAKESAALANSRFSIKKQSDS